MIARIAYLNLLFFIKVTFAQVPHLELMPKAIKKNLGDAIFVSCTADVPSPDQVTNLEWRGPDGMEIPNAEMTITTLEGLSGPNQLDLFIEKLREENVGFYNCSARYAGNQHLTAGIKIEYYIDIDFKDTETVQTPILNSDAKIRCVVTADPPPLIDWLKDGVPVRGDARHIQQNDGILIKNIQLEDEGVYRCRARVQALGEIEFRDIQVEVHIPPEITGTPKNTSGVEKESVSFQCVAKGKPAPVYSWVNKDSELLNDKEGYYVDALTGELRILDLRPEHTGTYRCTAHNQAGEVTAEAKLRVLTKPRIEEFLNITADVDKETEMRCIITGDPLPNAVFKKETTPGAFLTGINDDGRIEVEQQKDDHGRRVGVLKIQNLTRKDDGLYTCTGTSDGGETVAWGHITAQFPPTFEQQTQDEFWSWEQKEVNLTCLATSIPNATILWYLREEPIREADPNLQVLARGPNGILKVHPVDGSYFDIYRCKATNSLGVTEHKVSLKQVEKPGPVSSTQVEKKTATTVSWNIRDPLNDGGLLVEGYTVQYRLADTSWDKSENKYWPKGSVYIIDHLTPLAKYVFRFAARNEVGDGEWSGEKEVDMPKRSAPEEPLIYGVQPNVVKEIPYSDHYELQWMVPLDNGEPINFFEIRYFRVKNSSNNWQAVGKEEAVKVPSPGKSTFKLEGLQSDTFYKIELRAHNEIGYSTPSEAIIKTANAVAVETPITDPPKTSAGVIITIIVVAVLILLVIIDVICFFAKNVGLTSFAVSKIGAKPPEKDKEAMIEGGLKESIKTDGKQQGNDAEKAPEPIESPKEKEATETTPMIQGESDKDAILKEEEQKASEEPNMQKSESKNSITKDSSV